MIGNEIQLTLHMVATSPLFDQALATGTRLGLVLQPVFTRRFFFPMGLLHCSGQVQPLHLPCRSAYLLPAIVCLTRFPFMPDHIMLNAVCNFANRAMKLCGIRSDHLAGLAVLGQAPMEVRNDLQCSPGTELLVLLILLKILRGTKLLTK